MPITKKDNHLKFKKIYLLVINIFSASVFYNFDLNVIVIKRQNAIKLF